MGISIPGWYAKKKQSFLRPIFTMFSKLPFPATRQPKQSPTVEERRSLDYGQRCMDALDRLGVAIPKQTELQPRVERAGAAWLNSSTWRKRAVDEYGTFTLISEQACLKIRQYCVGLGFQCGVFFELRAIG